MNNGNDKHDNSHISRLRCVSLASFSSFQHKKGLVISVIFRVAKTLGRGLRTRSVFLGDVNLVGWSWASQGTEGPSVTWQLYRCGEEDTAGAQNDLHIGDPAWDKAMGSRTFLQHYQLCTSVELWARPAAGWLCCCTGDSSWGVGGGGLPSWLKAWKLKAKSMRCGKARGTINLVTTTEILL